MKFFDWFRKKQFVPHRSTDEAQLPPKARKRDVDFLIASIANLAEDHCAFETKAQAVARQLDGPFVLKELEDRLHSPTKPPDRFDYPQRGFGVWLAYWQRAIFEILFHYRERAIPFLRRIGFGEYDWTQANAIAILCRLAAEGIERFSTLDALRREYPDFRFEAQLYIVQDLETAASRDNSVADVVRELRDLPEWREALLELRGDGAK